MSQVPVKNSNVFSTRKVSADQAVKVLGRNGIRVSKEEAKVILDFLYLIARTYNTQRTLGRPVSWNPGGESYTIDEWPEHSTPKINSAERNSQQLSNTVFELKSGE
jgi:hypothetical protein